jgi:ABC-type glutathione transport system ATPase component
MLPHWRLEHVFGLFPRLDERRGHMGFQLSGGEQQMLAIARTLMTNPDLLLLDEPLEGLAPIVVDELAASIRRMIAEEGTAIVLVEQHAEIALSLTDQVLVIERGTIVHHGRSSELLQDPAALDRLIGLRVAETGRRGRRRTLCCHPGSKTLVTIIPRLIVMRKIRFIPKARERSRNALRLSLISAAGLRGRRR